MKYRTNIIAVYTCIAFFLACNTQNRTVKQGEPSYCASIDTLIAERYTIKTGNFYANKIIPKIVKYTKIQSTCEKGFYGYFYTNDSLFDADIKKWKTFLNCK